MTETVFTIEAFEGMIDKLSKEGVKPALAVTSMRIGWEVRLLAKDKGIKLMQARPGEVPDGEIVLMPAGEAADALARYVQAEAAKRNGGDGA